MNSANYEVHDDGRLPTALPSQGFRAVAVPPGGEDQKRAIVRAFAYRVAADIEAVAACLGVSTENLRTVLLETLVAVESRERLDRVVGSLDEYFRSRKLTPMATADVD